MALVDRVKNILLTPKTEWPVIAGETATVSGLYSGYIAILAAIGPFALALRMGLSGLGFGILLVSYLIALLMTYAIAWIIDAIAPSFGGEKNLERSLQLVAYSFTASWVAGIFHLLPVLGSLVALAGSLYSLYLFFLGAPVLRKCTPDKAVAFTVVIVLCAIITGGVLSYLMFSLGGFGQMGMM
jgi:hypothetical protein